MERISIQEIAAVLVTKSGLKKKEAERFGTMMFEVVKDGLASDRLVKIKGLGTFKVIDIEARESVNVNTGERVLIEGHGKVTFTPDATMKELVNKPFSQFETVILNEGVVFDDMPDEPSEPVVLDEPEVQTPPVRATFVQPEPEPITPEPGPITPEPEPIAPEPEVTEPEPITPEPESENIQTEPEIKPTEPEIQKEPEDIQTEITNEETMKPISHHHYEKILRSKVRIWAIITLLMCIASFGAGYFVGLNQGKSLAFDSYETQPIEVVETKKDNTSTGDAAKKQAPADNVKKTPAATEVKAVTEEKAATEEKKKEPATSAKPTEPQAQAIDKYAEMDGRVRTGAYRIVGTDSEVKARAGETVSHFSRRTLGPGMECYIEVYNGIKGNTILQEGQVLKVPKLEQKKLRKKQPQKVQTDEQTN